MVSTPEQQPCSVEQQQAWLRTGQVSVHEGLREGGGNVVEGCDGCRAGRAASEAGARVERRLDPPAPWEGSSSSLEPEKSNRLGLVTKSISQPDGPLEQRAHMCTAQVTSYEELKTKAMSGR